MEGWTDGWMDGWVNAWMHGILVSGKQMIFSNGSTEEVLMKGLRTGFGEPKEMLRHRGLATE